MARALSLRRQPYLCFIALLCISISGLLGVNGRAVPEEWTYQNQDQWGQDCDGRYQSPVNIRQYSAVDNWLSGSLVFGPGYVYPPLTSILLNNGHTAMVTVREQGDATVSGGPLPKGSRFKFEQLHFHWGANDALGSEHTLDGHRFPLELHMVHYNEAYGSFMEALGKKDGILVIAVWFDLDNRWGSGGWNSVLYPIVSSLSDILDVGDTTKLRYNRRLFDLLPQNKGSYFHYMGSLTTPPCTEKVHWIIYTVPQSVTSLQLREFRRLWAEGMEQRITSNYRQLQPLNGRAVYRVYRPPRRFPSPFY